MSPRLALTLAGALAALSASAQQRPSEGELFGDSPAEPTTPKPAAPASQDVPSRPDDRDAQALGGPPATNAFDTQDAVEDPLKIGGRFYLRATAQAREGVSLDNSNLTAPMLVDGYFDARPTDRLRGFVLGRLTFDPTLRASSSSTSSTTSTSSNAVADPRVLLDQVWLRFDLGHTVFVTVGKQHVKWGTSRFWNPTDFLTPQRKDPLALVDTRTGSTMLKLHVPWEAKGWNFYAIGLLDNAGPADVLGRVGGAARAEVLLGPAEVGVDAVVQSGRKPRFGIDVSTPLGAFDLYGELALKKGSDTPLFRIPAGTTFVGLVNDAQSQTGAPADLGTLPIEQYNPDVYTPQVSGGVTWTFPYMDNGTATLGLEYFYNALGYANSALYPYLVLQGQFQPFYLGRHYLAAYALVSGPGGPNDSAFILSNLGNLSDLSFTTRLDFTYRVLRYLSLETYVAFSYGQKGGEFRFALDVPSVRVGEQVTNPLIQAPPTVQLGVGLRMDL